MWSSHGEMRWRTRRSARFPAGASSPSLAASMPSSSTHRFTMPPTTASSPTAKCMSEGAALMQDELALERAPFAGRNHLPMDVTHRVQRAIQLLLPKLQKALHLREVGRKIVVLPDVALQEGGMIGHAIEDLGGRQAVALQHHF